MPWEAIKDQLHSRLPESALKLWIAPLECRMIDGKIMELAAPDRFFSTWVKENYLADIQQCLASQGLEDIEIRMTVKSETSTPKMLPSTKPENQLALPNIPRGRSSVRTLHPRYTFDEFMVGESNIMARSACEALANGDKSLGSCLYIDSGPGLGKSHLTHAVAHKVLAESPSTRIHYLTAQQLTAEMVTSIRNNTMEEFKEKYHRHCDVLLLEDIHSLSGRSKTQEELAAALDVLLKHGKTVIFTSKEAPRNIKNIEPEFRSRLTGGLITTINPPDLRTRTHIIRKKAENHQLALDDEMVDYIAKSIKGDIRRIESAMVGLKARMGIMGCKPDLEIVKDVVLKIVGCQVSDLSAEMIRDFIARQYDTSIEDLQSKSRKRAISFPRQVGMYLSRKMTEDALADIGRAYNRDHSTVVHAIRVISDSINRDGSIRGQIDLLTDKIKKQLG